MTRQTFVRALKRAMVPLKSGVIDFLGAYLKGFAWVVGALLCFVAAVAAWDLFTGVARQVQARQTWMVVAAMPGGDPIELTGVPQHLSSREECERVRNITWNADASSGRYVPLRCVPEYSWTALTIDYLFVKLHRR